MKYYVIGINNCTGEKKFLSNIFLKKRDVETFINKMNVIHHDSNITLTYKKTK